MADIDQIRGISDLQGLTLGDPSIRIAVLDGPPQMQHEALAGCRITVHDASGLAAYAVDDSFAAHATFVASVLFGLPDGPVRGIAPGCTGELIVVGSDALSMDSDIPLIRGIELAIALNVQIVHCAASLATQSGRLGDMVTRAFDRLRDAGILVVNPVANDHGTTWGFPAIRDDVLAVGSVDDDGVPAGSTNFGHRYEGHGVMANGTRIFGAKLGGGTERQRGTSCAAPIVTGVAALLMSRMRELGRDVDPFEVGRAIVASASPYQGPDADRVLGGVLDPMAALAMLEAGAVPAPFGARSLRVAAPSGTDPLPPISPIRLDPRPIPGLEDSLDAGATQSLKEPAQALVLGTIAHEVPSETVRVRLQQRLDAAGIAGTPEDPASIAALLRAVPELASSLTWVAMADGDRAYVLSPVGPLAGEVLGALVEILEALESRTVDVISLPGVRTGASAVLRDGARVPVLEVSAVRGLYAWERAAQATRLGLEGDQAAMLDQILQAASRAATRDGTGGPTRALNFLAANPVQLAWSITRATSTGMSFRSVRVPRSVLSRPYSDCWDVELTFTDTEDEWRAPEVHRHAIDVADAWPVSIGRPTHWRTTSPA